MEDKPTHWTIPLEVAAAVRQVLGQLPADQINPILRKWDQEGKPTTAPQEPDKAD